MRRKTDGHVSLSWLFRPREAIAQRDAALRQRDEVIGQLTHALRQRDEVAGDLKEALRRHDEVAGELTEALRRREEIAGELTAALRRRDEIANQLADALRQRDAVTAQFEAALRECAAGADRARIAQRPAAIAETEMPDREFRMRLEHRRSVRAGRSDTTVLSEAGGDILAFVHLAKTGGATLAHMIRGGLSDAAILDVPNPERHATVIGTWSPVGAIKALLALSETRRAQISAIVGHYGHGLHAYLPRGAAYVTLLRDPVDRLVSAFHYATAGRSVDADGSLITLHDYVFRKRHYDLGLDNGSTRVLSGDLRLDPIDPFATTGTTPLVSEADFTIAREHLRSYAVVGILERFDEFVLVLGAALGWSLCDLLYEIKNRTQARPAVSEIAPEVQAQILRWNQYDAALHHEAGRILDQRIDRYPWDFQQDLLRFRALMRMREEGAELADLNRYEITTLPG